MRKIIFITSLLLVWFLVACEKPNNNKSETESNLTKSPIQINEELTEELNSIFSENNQLVENITGDSLLFIINNSQEFSEICSDPAIAEQIDFENYCIIWGRIITPQTPYTLIEQELYNVNSTSYQYKITVEKCTDCWTVFGKLYYWGVYPKVDIQSIILTINYQ